MASGRGGAWFGVLVGLGLALWLVLRVTSVMERAPDDDAARPASHSDPAPRALEPARVAADAPQDSPREQAPPVTSPPELVRFRARLLTLDGGVPIGATLALLGVRSDTRFDELGRAEADAGGAVELVLAREVLAGLRAALAAAHALGSARVVVNLRPERWNEGVVELGELRLAEGADVVGSVITESGRALPGAVVAVSRLLGAPRDASAEAWRLWPLIEPPNGPYFPLATSDARGRFELVGVPTGTWALVARADPSGAALVPARLEPLALVAGERRDVGALVLAEPSPEETITGVTLDPEGAPLAGARVGLASEGVRHPGEAVSAADGRFTLLAPPGHRYRARATDAERRWLPPELEVESGARDVVLQFTQPASAPPAASTVAPSTPPGAGPVASTPPAAELAGRFTLAGAAAAGWTVTLARQSRELDAQGEFRLSGLAAGASPLTLSSGAPGADQWTQLAVTVELAPGRNSWSLDLPTATLVLDHLPPVEPVTDEAAGMDLPEFLLQGELESGFAALLFQGGAERRRTLADLPAGRWTLSSRAPGAQFGGEVGWSECARFELAAGERRTLVLP